ncbi:phosphate ABC transporter permease PstA [Amycolatopsis sp. GM8]|uniref:phosphate ABC transporter permease PstA n=1 Tax=Amycolatopsis sp. GM8 TaxID=2896530 RepID=UPI001F00035B|nr:phosphate ABC transporter permease PstA [Amycolatopsis sp. GM8]
MQDNTNYGAVDGAGPSTGEATVPIDVGAGPGATATATAPAKPTTATMAPAPPAPARPSGPAKPERRRNLRTSTLDDYLSVIGALIGSLCLVWLCYNRLLPFSGPLGFAVCWFVAFLALYAVVTSLRHGRPQLADRMMAVVMHAAAIIVVATLAYVVVSTLWGGRDALSHLNFFTEDLRNTGSLDPLSSGGVLHALVGTLVEIAISIVIVLPLGVLTAVYLNEVGGRAAQIVRTVVEAMTALPDILAGLFIYVLLLLVLGFQFSGFAAAVALSVTMLPITARAAEVVLRVVPNGLREASLALGASQWQTVWRVVLPTARAGLATALILGVARGIGETAPVLLTAGYGTYLNANPFSGPMASLPLFAYTLSKSPSEMDVARGYGGASVLLVLVVLLFVVARVLAGRGREGRR